MGSVVSDVARAQRAMRFRGRSYMAFVLTPEPPIADWLAELDEWIRSSTGYFVGRPVVLDLSGVTLSSGGIAHLISELSARDVRVMGLEGTEAEMAPGLPPVLRGGRRSLQHRSGREPARQAAARSLRRARNPLRSCSTARCARGSRSFFPMAT